MIDWLKKNLGGMLFWGVIISLGLYSYSNKQDVQNERSSYTEFYQSENRGEVENSITDYDRGYNWAEDEGIDDFDECQNEFGTGEAEDGCNEYVKENYSGYNTFGDYDCTEDCSGHEAGYNWAEENGISDEYDCDGNSNSFNEGCISYVEDNY